MWVTPRGVRDPQPRHRGSYPNNETTARRNRLCGSSDTTIPDFKRLRYHLGSIFAIAEAGGFVRVKGLLALQHPSAITRKRRSSGLVMPLLKRSKTLRANASLS